MKKIKLFTGMILALMCLSFNGCGATSGNEGDTITQFMLVKVDDSSVSAGCLYDINGTKLIPETPSVLYSLTNGLYQCTIVYDPSTIANNQVTVTLNSNPTSIMNTYGVINKAEYPNDENIPLYAINYVPRNLAPFMFDKDYLVVPVAYQSISTVNDSDISTELAKHRFVLILEPYAAGDDTLTFTLTDKVTDPDTERYYALYVYQAFDLRYVIANFKAQGNTLKKIVVKGMKSESTNNLEQATEETYSFDYNF